MCTRSQVRAVEPAEEGRPISGMVRLEGSPSASGLCCSSGGGMWGWGSAGGGALSMALGANPDNTSEMRRGTTGHSRVDCCWEPHWTPYFGTTGQ